MEYVAGEDLSTIIDRGKKPFEVAKVLDWADQLLDALDFLHNQVIPVVHRDIKPQNLKLTPKGKIVLLDFGLAKGNPTDAGHQTAAKSIFGYSRNYASLEQIQGTGTDPRSDLYSLAATLYHLMTGAPPEDALTRAMAVLTRKPDPLQPANALRSEIPAGVAGVLQAALALDAAERPSTAAEMRQMLASSEDYAHLAVVSKNALGDAPPRDVHFQATQLMPETTRAAGFSTDGKTEILDPINSSETALRSSSGRHSNSGKTKRFAAVVASLLIGVSALALGAAYVVNPELFGTADQTPAAETPLLSEQPQAVEAPAANTETVESTANSAVEEPAAQPEEKLAKEKTRTAATRTQSEDPANQKHPIVLQDEDGEVTMDDLEDPSEIVVTKRNPDGTLTRTKIKPKAHPNGRTGSNLPAFPFPNGFPAGLTPAQKRKISEAWREQIQQQREKAMREKQQQPVPPQTPQ